MPLDLAKKINLTQRPRLAHSAHKTQRPTLGRSAHKRGNAHLLLPNKKTAASNKVAHRRNDNSLIFASNRDNLALRLVF